MADLNIIKPAQVQTMINKFCCTIGMLPTSYKASLTYEEQILAIGHYLETVVYPAINQNAEALEELQGLFVALKDYVDNYFDNLDVQEEINNKLDEMAEDGTLTEIIAQYLELQGLLCYNTVSDLKNAENLNNESFTRTFGKNTYNDGNGYFYKIRELLNTDIIDEDNLIALVNYPTLVAEKIVSNVENTVKIHSNELKNKINKFIPKFISENENYYIRIGTKEHDIHYLQFSTDLINWNTICDLSYEIFMQPTSYPNTYDMACFIHNNEFYIIYDYVDENYNGWNELDHSKFLFGNRIGISKTSDFINWTKYAVTTPLEYKQIANPRLYEENNELYLCFVVNDGTLTQDETAYYHFPVICKLDPTLTETTNYMRLINSSENLIDPFIYKEGSNYYLFISAETPTRSMKVYKNNSLSTQFTTLVDTIDYFWNLDRAVTIEGASLIKKENLYYLIMDSVDHINVINVTNNIESWNNCFFATTDNIMGNAQVYEINTTDQKTLMKKFYEENDYPIFNKFTKIKDYDFNYLNQTKKTLTFYPIANKTFIAYSGQWELTIDKNLMLRDNDECIIINDTGSSNNLHLINLYGNNTSWYLPIKEKLSVNRTGNIALGTEYYSRKGHEAVRNIVANTKKTFTLTIPGVTYTKVRSIQLTPFTSGSNTKQIYCYVDSVSQDTITCSILSNENINALEIYWSVDIQ